VVGSYEYGNENFISIQVQNFSANWATDYHFLKKDCVP